MSDDILAQFEAIAEQAMANVPSFLTPTVDLNIIHRQATLFGQAVYWERCRKGLTHSEHHLGILGAVATCVRHNCGVSRTELELVKLATPAFLAELERCQLDIAQQLTLLSSAQGLFIVKGLGFSDSDITSEKIERFLLKRGDWWV